MPRAKKGVKRKSPKTRAKRATSLFLDLHFHGSFGVDLMRAQAPELEELCQKLASEGVQAFLATTLSAPEGTLEGSIARLGAWIQSQWSAGPRAGRAYPLGIHLEGPFLASSCCGAHPPEHLIPPSLEKLKKWWELSHGTLARITLAPELGSPQEILSIVRWCRSKEVSLSLGHSGATEEQALRWHSKGIRQLTHAWNAMPFHHRKPGALGAFLGKRDTFIELIPDGVHVSDTVLNWTHQLHAGGVFWVSDGVPAGGTDQPCSFGPLLIHSSSHQPVCLTQDGKLAGGALPLSKLAQAGLRRGLLAGRALQLRELCWETPWRALGLNPIRRRWKKALETGRY